MEKSYKFRNSACDANIHEIQKFWKQYETISYNLSWMNLRQFAQQCDLQQSNISVQISCKIDIRCAPSYMLIFTHKINDPRAQKYLKHTSLIFHKELRWL